MHHVPARRASALPLVFTLALAASAAAVPARAQQAPAEPPQRAPAPLAPDPIDAGFAQWSAGRVVSSAASMPRLVQGGRFEVLVLTPTTRRAMHAEHALVPVVTRCAEGAALGESARSEVTAIDPWAGFEAAASALPLVAISVIPSHGQATICGVPDAERFPAMARGVRFGRKPRYEATNDARAVELRIGGRAVEPAMAGRVPVSEVARGTIGRDGTMQVRLYVSPEVFAPGARGESPELEVLVWTASDSSPDRITLDGALSRAVWSEALRWRAERLSLSDGAATLDDLDATRPGSRAHLTTTLKLARSFHLAGDSAAARGFAARLVQQEPCLTLPNEEDPALRRSLDALRPAARCRTIPLSRIALRSLIPGGGQATGGRRNLVAALSLAAVAGSVVLRSSQHAVSRRKYEDYLAYDGFSGFDDPTVVAQNLYDQAESARTRGNTALAAGLAIWVFAAAEGVIAEQRHAARLRSVQEFRADERRASIAPRIGAQTVGLAVRFF